MAETADVYWEEVMPDDAEHLDKQLWKEVVLDRILTDIRWAIDADRHIVAAQLLLAGIDVIAGLERPAEQEETSGSELINWAEKYLKLAGPNYTLTGQDIWGARCGFLHGYTPRAKIVREGRAKMLGYMDAAEPPVMTDDPDQLVLVSLRALFQAFVAGTLDTMKRINHDKDIADRVNPRLSMMFRSVPAQPAAN